MPIFLREIETVTSHCENHSVVSLPTEILACRLESLTAMLHFAILAARAHGEICEHSVRTRLVSSRSSPIIRFRIRDKTALHPVDV